MFTQKRHKHPCLVQLPANWMIRWTRVIFARSFVFSFDFCYQVFMKFNLLAIIFWNYFETLNGYCEFQASCDLFRFLTNPEEVWWMARFYCHVCTQIGHQDTSSGIFHLSFAKRRFLLCSDENKLLAFFSAAPILTGMETVTLEPCFVWPLFITDGQAPTCPFELSIIFLEWVYPFFISR